MFRVWSNISNQIGPKLRKDTWWQATVVGVGAYTVLQGVAFLTALLIFLGRATQRCIIGPECGLVAGWPDGLVGLVTLVGGTFSLVWTIALWRILRQLWQRAFWTAYVLRGIGWATAFVGLLAVLGWGLPWLVVGAFVAWSAGKMEAVIDWPGGMDPRTAYDRDEGPVHTIRIDDDPIDMDNVVDVEFEDKGKR